MEEWRQEEGEVDTAITNNGARKGHEGPDQEHSGQGEYDTEYGEGRGLGDEGGDKGGAGEGCERMGR